MRNGLRRTSLLAPPVALAALLLAPAAPANAKLVKTSAQFIYYEHSGSDGHGCLWGMGIVVGAVPKATSYMVKYWDGYWKRVEVRTLTVEQLHSPDGPKGGLYAGVTGGGTSVDCHGGSLDTGRFSKGAKAWAIFPGKEKPKPFLNVTVKTPPPVPVGAKPKVSVTVTAREGAFKNVNLRGLTGGGRAVTVTQKPAGASRFSLGEGGSKTFTYTLKANLPGQVNLGASATGRSKKGSATGRGTGQLHVSAADLVLTTKIKDEAPVRLEVDKDGKVQPKTITVVAQVTNTSAADIDNVTIQSLNPVPAKKTDKLDQIAIDRSKIPIQIDKIPAGKPSDEYEFPLEVTGDGKYKIDGLVTFADASGGTGKATAESEPFEITVPPLWIALDRDPQNIKDINGSPYVDGGKTWYINGKLTNVSDYKRLCVYPLIPKLTGNAAAVGPVDITEQTSIREVGGPFAGAVEPNHDAVLQMYVDTAGAGGTVSYVQFKPAAGVLKTADQDCTDKTYKGLAKLGADDITFQLPPGGLGVGVDQRTAVPPGGSVIATGVGTALGVVKGLAIGTVQQGLDLLALVGNEFSYASQFNNLAAYGATRAATIVIRTSQTLATALDVYYGYLKGASAQTKGRWYERVAQTLKGASNNFYSDVKGLVADAVKPFNERVLKAYEKGGDSIGLGVVLGEPFGQGISQVVGGEFIKVLGKVVAADRLAIAEARLIEEAAEWEAKQARIAQETEDLLSQESKIARASVPPGTVLDEGAKARVWGIDKLTDNALQFISNKYKVLIGVRSRAVGSMRKLLKGSVLKHENLKPKNVNKIDIEYLGFKPGDFEEVRFRSYTPEQIEAIEARIQALEVTAEEKAAILKRWDTRRHEVDYLKDIRKYSKEGRIDVSFNYKDNGISRKSKRNYRGFHLVEDEAGQIGGVEAGGQYFTPLQENPDLTRFGKHVKIPENCRKILARILCTVTGDVDGVYVVNVDGTAVDAKKMVQIYGELMEKAGWQHPETVTWIDKLGEFFFGKKEAILSELDYSTKGAQAVVEYAPDQASRAAYIDVKASFDGAKELGLGPQNFRLRTVGGFSGTVAP